MKKIVSIIAVLAIATAAQAAVVFTHDGGTPTVDLPGYTTYQVSITTDTGNITGFELTLTGNGDVLNQINPAGNASIFQDSNGFFGFVGADVSQDTQFNFMLADVTLVSSSESAGSLTGIFALAGGTGSPLAAPSINVMQVCMPNGSYGYLTGKVTVGIEEVALTPPWPVPEPASLALLAVGGVSILARRKH